MRHFETQSLSFLKMGPLKMLLVFCKFGQSKMYFYKNFIYLRSPLLTDYYCWPQLLLSYLHFSVSVSGCPGCGALLPSHTIKTNINKTQPTIYTCYCCVVLDNCHGKGDSSKSRVSLPKVDFCY